LLFFARIFRPLLPGAAPFGDLPDLVNTSGVIEGLFSYGFYPSPNEPLQDGSGLYIQDLGNLGYSQSFHTYSIAYNLKKINSFEQQVIDKLVIYNYDVYIASHNKAWQRKDRNMAKTFKFSPLEDLREQVEGLRLEYYPEIPLNFFLAYLVRQGADREERYRKKLAKQEEIIGQLRNIARDGGLA
jgi:hypothetical protein